MNTQQAREAVQAELNRRQALSQTQVQNNQPAPVASPNNLTQPAPAQTHFEDFKRKEQRQFNTLNEQRRAIQTELQSKQGAQQPSLPNGSLNPELLATLDYPQEDNVFGSLGEGFRHGVAKMGLGVAQRGAQALQMAGVDVDDFLKDMDLMHRVSEKQGAATREASPITTGIGEVVGEIAAMPLPATKIPGIIGTGLAIGGAQYGEKGTLKEFGENTAFGGIAGLVGHYGGEAMVRLVRTAAAKVGKKVPNNLFNADGTLKPEAQGYFDKEGISEELLSEHIQNEINTLPQGSDVKQAIRKAEARELGVTELTKGDISQTFDDQTAEYNLSRNTNSKAANTLRDVRGRQNIQLIEAGENTVQSMGEPDKLSLGASIQEGLRSSKRMDRDNVGQLYKHADELTGGGIPVDQKGIAEEFYNQQNIFENDPDIEKQFKPIQTQLELYGVLEPNLVTDATRIKPLTTASIQKLRKNINAVIDETKPKNQRAARPIINAIDETLATLEVTNDMSASSIAAFNKARKAFIDYKKTYSAKDIIQKIVSKKKGTDTDEIHPSVIYDQIMGTRSRLEATQAVKKALLKGGHNDTWNDFKATAAAELIGKGVTTGKTASGEMKFSGANFNKALKKIGDPTLKTIFGPSELARIRQLGRVSRDLTVLQNGVETPSGAHVSNTLHKLAKFSFWNLGPFLRVSRVGVEKMGDVLEGSNQRTVLSHVLNPSVDVARELGGYSNTAINAFRLMAISGQSQLREE